MALDRITDRLIKVFPFKGVAGAVQRALRAKLADTRSVADFGAVADGVTDDYAAFSVAGASGKSVLVPPGVYFLSASPSGTFYSAPEDMVIFVGPGIVALVSATIALGGTVTGILPIANGGTNANSAAGARANLGLGTAAQGTLGTAANNVVQLDTDAKLPAVDGSQLTGVIASGGTGFGATVRHTVLSGPVDATKAANILAAGTGLAVNINATSADPVVMTTANGFGAQGAVDTFEVFNNPITGAVAVPASSLVYIFRETNTAWKYTRARPQYNFRYNKLEQALLHFNGTAGATAFVDDNGNACVTVGGAKLQTNQLKFGVSALGGGGAANILDGVNDYVSIPSIKSLSNAGWTMRGWVYCTTLPAANTSQTIISNASTTGFGANLFIRNTAGTIKFSYSLSSQGTSADIASLVLGTTTPVVNTWYFVELTWDSVAGVYRLYVNGVQEQSTASALTVEAGSGLAIGATAGTFASKFVGYLDEVEILPYCDHPAGVSYTAPTAASDIVTDGYSPYWFDIQDFQMKKISGANSVSAGGDPTFTAVQYLAIGQVVTDAVGVTSAITYAFRRYFESDFVTPLVGAAGGYTVQHNLGTLNYDIIEQLVCIKSEAGYIVGDVLEDVSSTTATVAAMASPLKKHNSVTMRRTSGGATGYATNHATTGVFTALSIANWQYKVIVKGRIV